MAALTGIAPSALIALDEEMFEAVCEEADQAQWGYLTELVAKLCDRLGYDITRPTWVTQATRKAAKKSPQDLLAMVQAGRGKR